MTGDRRGARLRGERRPLGEEDLQTDEVEARDELGDRVLDLSRVFISRKAKVPSSSRTNSTVPAPTYPTAAAARTAASPISVRRTSSTAGEGASSTTFWWRRWTEHSRSKSDTTVPCTSAMTWTSTCRGRVTYRSRNTVPSPNAAAASRAADVTASWSPAGPSTIRMPRPPPPALAFTSSGYPMSAPSRSRPAASSPVASPPGRMGTPACDIIALAASFEPIDSIADGGGPTHVSPAASHARAKPAFSERKP